MELQSIIASPAAIGVAPIALLMASISLTGPAIREVPVSAIASHPCWQTFKSDPIWILNSKIFNINFFLIYEKIINNFFIILYKNI